MTNTITLSVVPELANVKNRVEPSPVAVVVAGFKAIVLSTATETPSPDIVVSIPEPPVILSDSPNDIVVVDELSSTSVIPELVNALFGIFETEIETPSPETAVSIPVPPVIESVSPSEIVAEVELSSTNVILEFVGDELAIFVSVLEEPLIVFVVSV